MSMYGDYVVPATLASSEDYSAFTHEDAPPNIDRILTECSALVLDATVGAIYDVDSTTGIATDARIQAALRDMTCAQAAAWVALKIDPNLAGVATLGSAVSKKIGSAAFTYSDSDATAASSAKSAAMVSLVPSAVRIGRLNDLLGNEPYAL